VRVAIGLAAMAVIARATLTALTPEDDLLRRGIDRIRGAEPGWRFVAAIMNVPPSPGRVGIAGGALERSEAESRVAVSVDVERFRTADAAAEVLSRTLSGAVHPGWTAEPYQLGDGAAFVKYYNPPVNYDSLGHARGYTLTVRKREYLVRLSSYSQADVERLSRLMIE
jgi:hypothetical protein